MESYATTRFSIELIKEEHLEHLLHYATVEELWIYSTIKISNASDFKKYFNQALRMSKQTTQNAFVVYDNLQKKYVGMTRLYAFDSKNSSTKLGFSWYDPQLQGSGINAHIKYLMLRLAFEKFGMNRVELNADLRNKRSIAAMRKIGFVEEGILRQALTLPDGHKRDTIVFSLLKEEWPTIKMNLKVKIFNI